MVEFGALDTNGDGGLTLEEMQAAAAARFAAADTDGDGGLSAAEMLAQREADNTERAERRAARMIERLDENEDGLVQIEELAEARRPLDRMFERVDTDEDGVISQAEFDDAREHMGERRHGHGGDRRHGHGDRDRG
jgi:Ca2+-binding EF-hand superfamily protein